MALTAYQTQTQRLLHDSTAAIFPLADLTYYINVARQEIALEGEVCRAVVNQASIPNVYTYPFSTVFAPSGSGLLNVAVVRQIFCNAAPIRPCTWEWYSAFNYPNFTTTGTPTTWAVLGGGVGATLYLWPTPNTPNFFSIDAVWVPILLTSDTTIEALPFPWTNAVPYYAAYLAYMFAQRSEDADHMWQLYQLFMRRARQLSTSTLLPEQYAGANAGTRMADMSQSLSTPISGGKS